MVSFSSLVTAGWPPPCRCPTMRARGAEGEGGRQRPPCLLPPWPGLFGRRRHCTGRAECSPRACCCMPACRHRRLLACSARALPSPPAEVQWFSLPLSFSSMNCRNEEKGLFRDKNYFFVITDGSLTFDVRNFFTNSSGCKLL